MERASRNGKGTEEMRGAERMIKGMEWKGEKGSDMAWHGMARQQWGGGHCGGKSDVVSYIHE